ncbi:MAG: hypothetical protein NTY64_11360 [Deltaproteobacteria bacterium]|nr:hypothetical protein [Deltaproteobacteria bacterium]
MPRWLVARVEVRSRHGGTGKTVWDSEGIVAFTSIPLPPTEHGGKL